MIVTSTESRTFLASDEWTHTRTEDWDIQLSRHMVASSRAKSPGLNLGSVTNLGSLQETTSCQFSILVTKKHT